MQDGDQFTVPLEDTVVMESPILETQWEEIDVNTEVLDESECVGKMGEQSMDDVVEDSVTDIILDSDEEGNEVASINNGLSLKETKASNKACVSDVRENKASVPGHVRGQGGKVSGHSVLLTYNRRIRSNGHCNTGQPGPAFLQGSAIYQVALGVQDSGICMENEKVSNEMNINYDDKDHKRWQIAENVKGINLVGDILNEENSAPPNYKITDKARDVPFAHADSQVPQELSEANALRFIDEFVSVNNVTSSGKAKTGRGKGIQSPPSSRAKGVQTLARRALFGPKARKAGIFDWEEEPSSKYNFVKQFDKYRDMGSQGEHLEKDDIETNMPETFDIVFNTQMAAEAMEALLYSDLPVIDTGCAIPENNISNYPETGIPKATRSKVCGREHMAGKTSRITARQSENTRAGNKLHGSLSCTAGKQSQRQRKTSSLSPLENNVISMHMKKSMNGRDSKLFGPQKKDGVSERENLQKDTKPVECKNSAEEPRKSQATKGIKCLPSMSSLEGPNDPVLNYERIRSCKVEFNAPETKRKRSRVNLQLHKKLGVKRKCSNLGSDGSTEARNLSRTWHGKFCSDLNGTTGLLELALCNYPKRRRTQKNMACHSIERRYSVSSPMQKTDRRSLSDFGNCESAITCEQMAPMELPKRKFSKQSCKIDGKDSISSLSYTETTKFGPVADHNKASETSKSDEDCEKSGKAILSKPSLMKELTRLGYNNSLPEFLPRETRRHNRATVLVLFSQHLQPNIISQQKNIIARLGFSIASCCSDATHFVTDRFVRTRNMLEAIAVGKPVVTPLWLESCGRARYHIDEKNYILRDAKKEKEIGFSMPISLACARQHPLLKGQRVFITQNIKPDKELIQGLVKSVEGKEIQRAPPNDEITSTDVLILSSEGDYTSCVPFLEKGAAVYDSELLLNGIVIQKLEYERHRLFTNYDESKSSRVGRRKT